MRLCSPDKAVLFCYDWFCSHVAYGKFEALTTPMKQALYLVVHIDVEPQEGHKWAAWALACSHALLET